MAATYQGPACGQGHDGTRYVSTRGCVACAKDREASRAKRRTTRASRRKAPPAGGAIMTADALDGLDALLGEAWGNGRAYAVTISHKGRRPDGRPAGFAVTVHAFGHAYTADNGSTVTPCVQHKGEGATPSEALALAVQRAAGLFPMAD